MSCQFELYHTFSTVYRRAKVKKRDRCILYLRLCDVIACETEIINVDGEYHGPIKLLFCFVILMFVDHLKRMEKQVQETSIPEQIFIEENLSFPLVFTPKPDQLTNLSDTVAFLEEHRDEILARLLKTGAILFRGFPVPDAQAFDAVARAFKWAPLPYVGGAAPRTQVTEIVFTSNESPPSQPIPFHHEMAKFQNFLNI